MQKCVSEKSWLSWYCSKGFTKSSAMKYEPEYFQKYDVDCSVFEGSQPAKDVLH